jgi:hypothetical protein
MNIVNRLKWWFSGKMSKMISEDYDDIYDAAVMPFVSAGMTGFFVYSAVALTTINTLVARIASAIFGIYGVFGVYMTILSFAASMQLANEWTHPSGLTEEVND